MITGDLRSKIDRIWDDFWSGGISNPLTVIEQITYLLFIKRLDEIHTNRELTANINKTSIENPVFPQDRPFLRWSRFKDMEARDMYENIVTHVFPFIKNLHNDEDSAYSIFMKDAVFIIPTPRHIIRMMVEMVKSQPDDIICDPASGTSGFLVAAAHFRLPLPVPH